jgi:hypothetical protein
MSSYFARALDAEQASVLRHRDKEKPRIADQAQEIYSRSIVAILSARTLYN